jgi:hypothetical protein
VAEEDNVVLLNVKANKRVETVASRRYKIKTKKKTHSPFSEKIVWNKGPKDDWKTKYYRN